MSNSLAALLLLLLTVPESIVCGRAVLAANLRSFLVSRIGFSEDDLRDMENGEAVVKILKASQRNEVAAFGIVGLNASKELFVERFRDISEFKKSPDVLEVGKFSRQPRLSDLDPLTVDPEDIDDIKGCKPGNCDVKMSAAEMARFEKEIDWKSPGYRTKAVSLFKRMLFGLVESYLTRGNSALIQYQDQKSTVRVADAFDSLLASSAYIYEFAPELSTYLREYPRAQLPGVENFMYWSKEKFGLKPVITLTHVAIYRKNVDGRSQLFIASKQIYASHYFEASLGLTVLADDVDAAGKPATYLMYLNRSRSDALDGGFSPVKRSIVSNRARQGMERYLRLVKTRIESNGSASASN